MEEDREDNCCMPPTSTQHHQHTEIGPHSSMCELEDVPLQDYQARDRKSPFIQDLDDIQDIIDNRRKRFGTP